MSLTIRNAGSTSVYLFAPCHGISSGVQIVDQNQLTFAVSSLTLGEYLANVMPKRMRGKEGIVRMCLNYYETTERWIGQNLPYSYRVINKRIYGRLTSLEIEVIYCRRARIIDFCEQALQIGISGSITFEAPNARRRPKAQRVITLFA